MIVLIVYVVIVFIMLFTLMYLKRLHKMDCWVGDEVDMVAMSMLWPLIIPGFLVILFWEMIVKVFNRIIDAVEEAREKNDRKRDL